MGKKHQLYEFDLQEEKSWWELQLTPQKFKLNWKALNRIELGSWMVLLEVSGTRWGCKPVLEKAGVKGALFYKAWVKGFIGVAPKEEMGKIAVKDPFQITIVDSDVCPTKEQLELLSRDYISQEYSKWKLDNLNPFMTECNSKISYILNDGRDATVVSRDRTTLLKVITGAVNELIEETTNSTARSVDWEVIEKAFDDPSMCIRLSSSAIIETDVLTIVTLWTRGEEGIFTKCRNIEITNKSQSVTEWEESEESEIISGRVGLIDTILGGALIFILLAGLVAIPITLIWGVYELIIYLFG